MKHSKLYLATIAILCVFIDIFTTCLPNKTNSGNSNQPGGGTRIQTETGQNMFFTAFYKNCVEYSDLII